MPISEDGTQEKSTRLEVMRWTIDGWLLIHLTSSGNTAVISTWSASSQSRLSSTSTNMCTKVMIALLWSLEGVRMKSSFIWTPAMCLPVKPFGDCCALKCMRNPLTSSDFKFIFQTNSWSCGTRTVPTFRQLLKTKGARIPLLQLTLKPMPIPILTFQQHIIFFARTFLQNLYGNLRKESGVKGRQRKLHLVECTMPIQALGNDFISIHCFVLSKVLHHLKIYDMLMELFFQPFMLPVWHEAYWRMIMSGGNVFRKLLIWQVVINCATSLSPFFVIALHLILWLFGWNSELTFVMIFTTGFTPEALLTILLKTKCLIMAFISS